MTTAYCVKCKSKQEMENPIEGKTVRGVPMVKGTCSKCQTRMCVIGRKR